MHNSSEHRTANWIDLMRYLLNPTRKSVLPAVRPGRRLTDSGPSHRRTAQRFGPHLGISSPSLGIIFASFVTVWLLSVSRPGHMINRSHSTTITTTKPPDVASSPQPLEAYVFVHQRTSAAHTHPRPSPFCHSIKKNLKRQRPVYLAACHYLPQSRSIPMGRRPICSRIAYTAVEHKSGSPYPATSEYSRKPLADRDVGELRYIAHTAYRIESLEASKMPSLPRPKCPFVDSLIDNRRKTGGRPRDTLALTHSPIPHKLSALRGFRHSLPCLSKFHGLAAPPSIPTRGSRAFTPSPTHMHLRPETAGLRRRHPRQRDHRRYVWRSVLHALPSIHAPIPPPIPTPSRPLPEIYPKH